jgi:hypothetical protein
MKSTRRLFIFIYLLIVLLLQQTHLYATIRFSSRNATFLLEAPNSQIGVTPSTLYGWANRSIIKNEAGANFGTFNLCTYDQNANKIISYNEAPTEFVYSNSMAINNLASNGIDGELTRVTSNALLYFNRTSSNSLLFMGQTLSNRIANNSNAINRLAESGVDGELARVTSNALLFIESTLSNRITNNSNAIVYLSNNSQSAGVLLKQTSNAVNHLATSSWGGGDGSLARANSNALLFGLKNLSNTIISEMVHATSYFATSPVYELSQDLALSINSFLIVNDDTIIDGHGHTIDFANGASNLIQVAGNKQVIFQDIYFPNYNDSAIALEPGASVVFGNNTHIDIENSQSLMRDWTFQQSAVVHGHGTQLDLDVYTINALPSSILRFNNLSIAGLKAHNIDCHANSTNLIIENCVLGLSQNFSFTAGSITIQQDSKITGTNTFAYATNQPLIIDPFAQLQLHNTKFSYQPSSDNRDLIVMSDKTSELYLNDSSLISTTTGLRLTTGTLIADGKNILINDGAIRLSEGFAIGNQNPLYNLDIIIKPGASLNLQSGILDYQNVE